MERQAVPSLWEALVGPAKELRPLPIGAEEASGVFIKEMPALGQH